MVQIYMYRVLVIIIYFYSGFLGKFFCRIVYFVLNYSVLHTSLLARTTKISWMRHCKEATQLSANSSNFQMAQVYVMMHRRVQELKTAHRLEPRRVRPVDHGCFR
jgi:hypothetical protein